MSKRGTKRKADVDLASEASESLFAKDVRPKRKMDKRTKKRLSRLEEYDEDEGRAGSRDFQKWAQMIDGLDEREKAASQTFMKGFKEKVKKQSRQMSEYVEKQDERLIQSRKKSALVLEKLYAATAFSSGPPDGSSAGPRSANKESHFLFRDAQALLAGSQSLLRGFRETEERLKTHKMDLPTVAWKQDKMNLQDILNSGREQGEKLVDGILFTNAYSSPKPDSHSEGEANMMAADFYKESRKGLEGDTWGMVAAEQMKRTTALAELGPPQEPRQERHWDT